MSKTTVFNYLQIAAIFFVALLAFMFNTNDKVNMETGIALEAIVLAITLVWRVVFHEEITLGE